MLKSLRGWVGTMEEKDMNKELERVKKGIKEGWLFDEYDGDDDLDEFDEEIEIPVNKESVFEKYKKSVIEDDKADK